MQGWRDALSSSFANLGESVAQYLPRVVAAVVILGAGWVVSAGIAWLSRWTSRRLGIDRGASYNFV